MKQIEFMVREGTKTRGLQATSPPRNVFILSEMLANYLIKKDTHAHTFSNSTVLKDS